MLFGYHLAWTWLICTCSEKIDCGLIYKMPTKNKKRKQNNLVFIYIHVLKNANVKFLKNTTLFIVDQKI